MTSLGVVERTERVEGKQRGREMGPVSGFLRKPRAFQTLSRCTVFPQLLLVNFKYSHAGVVCPALMGGQREMALCVLGESVVQSPGKGLSDGKQGQVGFSGLLAGLWG